MLAERRFSDHPPAPVSSPCIYPGIVRPAMVGSLGPKKPMKRQTSNERLAGLVGPFAVLGVMVLVSALFSVPTAAGASQFSSIVRGKIVDADGNGLEGVKVTIEPMAQNFERPVEPIVIESNDDGNYLARNVVIGDLRLLFELEGYESVLLQESVRAGPNRFDVTMNEAVVSDEVVRANTANAAYAAGRDAFNAGNYAEVVGYMEQALAATGAVENAEALGYIYALLGRAYFEQRMFNEAIVAYRKWIEYRPDIANPHIELAQSLAKIGEQDEAGAEFQAAIDINPDDPLTHYNMGVVMVNTGTVAAGIVYIEKAVELRPVYPLAYKNLGYAYAQTERYAEAITAFEMYLEQSPDAPDAKEVQQFIVALKDMIGSAQQQRPSYGASVEVVRLHVTVLDRDGNPVTRLRAADFVVVDNGVEHPVALALAPEDTPIDVALVFDQSDSIRRGAPTVKQDARAFLDALGPSDCAFVLPFRHKIGPGTWGPAADPEVLETIDRTRIEGGTSFNDAVIVGVSEVQGWNVPDILAPQVVTEFERPRYTGGVGISIGPINELTVDEEPEPNVPGFGRDDRPFRVFDAVGGCPARGGVTTGSGQDRRRALVVLSDGVDMTSSHSFSELLGFVYETDVPIFTVALGHASLGAVHRNPDATRALRAARARMEMLAESTGGLYVQGSGSATLREAYESIVTTLRGSYLLGYYPRSSTLEGEGRGSVHRHTIEVKTRRRGLRTFARSEYYRRASDTQVARVALRRGAELALAGELVAAQVQAQQAIIADPMLWDGHYLSAAVAWMQQQPDAALAALSEALRLEPGVVASHLLAWQLHYDAGDDAGAWEQLIHASHADADVNEIYLLLAGRSEAPDDLAERLSVPRIFIEGTRGDRPEVGAWLAPVTRALARAVSESPAVGLVRDPLATDYFLYIDSDDPDDRSPQRLDADLELYNLNDRRLWDENLRVADIDDEAAVATAVDAVLAKLHEWLEKR